MAEANDPTDPAAAGEKPETEKPASVAGPTDSPEAKPEPTTGEEAAGGAVSADTGDKAATSKAEQEAKPAKKSPKKKKEEAAPKAPAVAAAPENLSLSADAVGIGLFTHMHVRGKAMSFAAHTPDGKAERLLTIPNYNFEWQIPYRWEPGKKVLPKGTRLECVALYDNSQFNPYNPDPSKTVKDGPQTYQEMMNGFLFYVEANEKLGLDIDPKSGRVVTK